MNLIISNEEIYTQARSNRKRLKFDVLCPMAEAVGFGFWRWIDTMRDAGKTAHYMTKLAMELTGSVTKDQTPTNAPKHFRRLRASVGLLPKRFKDDTVTGMIIDDKAEFVANRFEIDFPPEDTTCLPRK